MILPSRKIWTPPQRQRGFIINPYRYATGGGGATDPYFANVVLLMNMGGAPGSTAFADLSPIARTLTPSGGVQIDTSLGYNAAKFDGSSDYIVAASSSDFDMGTGDFAMEFWVVPTLGADRGVICRRNSGTEGWALEVRSTGAAWLRASVGGSYSDTKITTTTGLFANATLAHLCLARSGSSWALACNGTVAGTLTNSGTLDFTAGRDIHIGHSTINTDENPYSGFIKAVRITKGTSRGYTSNFTPDSAPFPTS